MCDEQDEGEGERERGIKGGCTMPGPRRRFEQDESYLIQLLEAQQPPIEISFSCFTVDSLCVVSCQIVIRVRFFHEFSQDPGLH